MIRPQGPPLAAAYALSNGCFGCRRVLIDAPWTCDSWDATCCLMDGRGSGAQQWVGWLLACGVLDPVQGTSCLWLSAIYHWKTRCARVLRQDWRLLARACPEPRSGVCTLPRNQDRCVCTVSQRSRVQGSTACNTGGVCGFRSAWVTNQGLDVLCLLVVHIEVVLLVARAPAPGVLLLLLLVQGYCVVVALLLGVLRCVGAPGLLQLVPTLRQRPY